jgi:hypothetical protein
VETLHEKEKEMLHQNYFLLLKIALNLLNKEKTEKQWVKGKRLKDTWDEDYLKNVCFRFKG